MAGIKSTTIPHWISVPIQLGAGFFIFALFLSAVFDPTIRLLHVLQALIYIAVIVLTRKKSAWGYGAGSIISVFWNYINLFATNFIASGWQQFLYLLQTGQLHRPDQLIALVAAAGHVLLIFGCLAGFFRARPGIKQWGQFIGGGALALGYFVAIIITSGQQYIGLLKRVFRL